ncbi:MAG: ABC transporter ATP-binding protein [Polyangiales bacterium]
MPPADVADGLTLRGVRRRFVRGGRARVVLGGIDLTVHGGEVVALVGASGCGKSTLLRIVAGLDLGYAGSVRVGDRLVREPGTDRGIVFQEHRLFPWLSVADNVAFGVLDRPTSERAETVRGLLARVGLCEFADAYPHQLSGGMAQRAALARALAPRPRVLLLDEPFGALDAITKMQLQDELTRIREAERGTLLLVTHDVDEAVYLADRVVVLAPNPGRVRAVVDIDLSRPRDRTGDAFAALRRRVFHELFVSQEKT